MATITFDTLKCMKRLKEAGVPAAQAEAQAEVLAEAFVQNVDNLVTRDYLDVRMEALDSRFEAIDSRFEALDSRFEALDSRLEALESRMNGKFRLQNWMMGIAFSILVLPQLRALLV